MTSTTMTRRLRASRAAAGLLLLTAATLGTRAPASAQEAAPVPDLQMDRATRRAVIDGVLERVREAYVFPDRTAEIERTIRSRQRSGAYDGITSASDFADSLSTDLRAAGKDEHLGVWYSVESVPAQEESPQPSAAEAEAFARFINAGFARVERFPGNVGYLKLDGFVAPEEAREAAAAAMRFLGGTDALILDLRDNQGGKPEGVAQFLGYFLGDGRPVHVNSIYWREGHRTEKLWTNPKTVAAPYSAEKPVFVLTSAKTFSAGEELAYDLQAFGRAKVVGEVTRGGANPTRLLRAHEHFLVGVPNRRAINPVTGTNWEGVGVQPDVPVPAEEALHTARRLALEAVGAEKRSDWQAEEIEAALQRVTASSEDALMAIELETAAAWNRADLDAHVAAYADSAVFMAPGPVVGREKIRDSLARGFWRSGKPAQDLRYEEISIRPLGTDHALMTGRFVLYGGGRPEHSGWFTLVWERTADGWQIIHDHSS